MSIATPVATLNKATRVPLHFLFVNSGSALVAGFVSVLAITDFAFGARPGMDTIVYATSTWMALSCLYLILIVRSCCKRSPFVRSETESMTREVVSITLITGGATAAAIENVLFSVFSATSVLAYHARYDGRSPSEHDSELKRVLATATWKAVLGLVSVLSLATVRPGFIMHVLAEARVAAMAS